VGKPIARDNSGFVHNFRIFQRFTPEPSMKPKLPHALLLSLALTALCPAKESPTPAATSDAVATSADEADEADPVLEAKRNEQDALAAENKLQAERLTKETNAMRAEITRLKMERELLTEKQALEDAKRQVAHKQELVKMDEEKDRIASEGELSKVRAEKLANDLKAVQTEAALEIARLQNEISEIETSAKRDQYADLKPVYLKKPLKDDGMLVISDRRIPLNGLIATETADYVADRIHYWNNKDRELPIFIVIDSSPGGSVMAGYRILKAMESSEAPVHVVVKSFAASMAAAITTLATESYAYPNAVILHHQISSRIIGQLNLTQQREFHEESQRWWARLGTPIAQKMGVTTDELIKMMYSHSSSGDWSEFGEEARKLKWVNHIVRGIDETSINKNPDSEGKSSAQQVPGKTALVEEIDSEGKPFAWLPHLNPKDVFFLYNPDDYYRMR
jgi:ATP-dependent Clp protease protease subunit